MSQKVLLSQEEDEELIRQDIEFQKQNCSPAANLIRKNEKRKSYSSEREIGSSSATKHSTDSSEKNSETGSMSKFAKAHKGNKKKKLGMADFTVLQEAVSKEESKTVVLGRIVERNVPFVSPHLSTWTPVPSPYGFPKVSKMCFQERDFSKRREISYYMEQVRRCPKMEVDSEAVSDKPFQHVDEKLLELGKESFIVDGKTALQNTAEVAKIHNENISLLSSMSHEKRIEERNELISILSPEQLQFIKSLRTSKGNKKAKSFHNMEVTDETNNMKVTTKTNYIEDANETSKMEISTEANHKVSNGPLRHELRDNTEKSTDDKEESLPCSSNVNISDKPNDNSEDNISGLPFSPKEAKRWLHMDKVELDKLRWTTEVPPIRPLKYNVGYIARFNFEGDLLPYDSDTSWREGLHHHGSEPARAGYTMDELFIFVRSNVNQQRHIGLKTLANVLRNTKEGLYDSCFDSPILQLMVDAGLVLLLRFAIDEPSSQIYQEALKALYYLICNEPDEKCLNMLESWVPHDAQPGVSSTTHSTEKDRNELDEEEKELKDVEVIQLDIIRALIRMDVHIRLRYFLESVNLAPPDVIYILGILKRICQHSLTAAWTITSTPRLLSAITNHFLPHNISGLLSEENVDKITSVYGIPLRHVLSLFKVLASHGRHIASYLINNNDLMSRILAYVSIEANQVSMPQTEVLALTVEAYGLWAIFLHYGLSKAQHSFSSFYPLMIKQLLFYRDKVDVDNNIMENKFNYDVGSNILNVLTKALDVAATKPLLVSRMKNNESTVLTVDGKAEVLQPPVLEWDDFNQIFSLVESCLYKWMTQFLKNPDISFSGLKLIGCSFKFLTTYYSKWRDQHSFEGVKVIQKLNYIYDKILHNFCTSDALHKHLRNLKLYSNLVSKLNSGHLRDPKNLGSVASVCFEGEVVPILQNNSPFPFLLPYFSFLKTLFTVHPTLKQTSISHLLDSNVIKTYLEEICSSQRILQGNWMSRVEIFTVASILEIAAIVRCSNPHLYHKVAISLLPAIHKGDEHLIKSFIENIICNNDFTIDISDVDSQIDNLSVKDYTPLKSPAIQQPIIAPLQLTMSVLQSLPLIGQDLVKNLIHSKALEVSLMEHNSIPFLINTLTRQCEEIPLALDSYWSLYPLKLMVLLVNKNTEGGDQTSSELIISVIRWLQLTFLLLRYRASVINVITNPTGWMRHLSLAFLASNDLFLDVKVNSYLQSCLASILENENYQKLDCTLTFPNLQLSYDWYKDMVVQYGSISYGDSTFALFLLIPLQRHWPETYRTFLFGEQSEILPFIRLTTENVSQFIPIKQFLEPSENDETVILKYRSALGNNLINKERTPFLYKFTVHHISCYANIKQKKT